MRRADGESSLNGSCMNNDGSYYKMLEQSNNVRIVVATTPDGSLAARALLWNLEAKIDNRWTSITFMDRIYVAMDWMYDVMLDFAHTQKFWTRTNYKTMEYKCEITSPDGLKYDYLELQAEVDQCHDSYPYMDTLAYGDGSILSNIDCYSYTYKETDGSRGGESEDDSMYCPVNDEHYDPEDMQYIDKGRYSGESIHEDDAVRIGRYWYWNEDELVAYIASEDEYVLREDARYCKHSREYIRESDAVYVDAEDDYYHADDVVTLEDGEYYLARKACKIGGEWYKEEDCVEVGGRYELKQEEAA